MRPAAVVVLASLSLAAASSVAAAQPAQPEELSESTALALSLGGTVASYAAVGAGIALRANSLGTAGSLGVMFAPSFGHWYAGTYLTRGEVLRATGLLTLLVGAVADSQGCSLFGEPGNGEPANCNDAFRTPAGTVLMLGGIAMFVGGTVDDIVRAPARVRSRNAELHVQPMLRADGGGISLAGTF
jgi:hypothetical protein